MNEADFLLLKAQFEAFRTWAIVRDSAKLSLQQKWKSRSLLWGLEREILREQEIAMPSALDKEPVCRRIFELQILLDVAHIHGNLAEYGAIRYIDPITSEKAKSVAPDEYYEDVILQKFASLF